MLHPKASLACLACLATLLPTVRGQDSYRYSQNLTLVLTEASKPACETATNISSAIEFTTFSIPIAGHCFNFRDFFASANATSGFVNQSALGSTRGAGEPGIAWQIKNMDDYSSSGNYSQVWYRQQVFNPSEKRYKPGHFAHRSVRVFPGEDCGEADGGSSAGSGESSALPWYGWSCWSQSDGECSTLPYSVGSFLVAEAYGSWDDEEPEGTCWDFAREGTASNRRGQMEYVLLSVATVTLMLLV